MSKSFTGSYVLGIFLISLLGVMGFYPALEKGKIIAPTDIQEAYIQPYVKDGVEPHNTSTSDAVTQYVPYRMFYEKAYQEDGYIGWNPYAMCGFNMAGNTMALPGSWATQLHRFMSLENAWNWGIILEVLIAGIGMFTFLRGRKLKWVICLLGAMIFMWNSQFMTWVNHRWALGSFCWMPWILWASHDVFNGNLLKRHFALPFLIGLAVLGGSLQHIAFIVLACGCLVLAKSKKSNRLILDWPYAFKWTMLVCISLALVSYSLIPQISAYLSNVSIGHVRGGIGYENGISQILKHIVVIPAQIWPWLMGDPTSMNGSAFLELGFANIAYIGTVPMIAAMLGVLRKSLPLEAKLMIVIGLLIPLTPLVGPLYHRVQIVFILGGVWLFCETLNELDTGAIEQLRKWSLRLLGVIVVSLVCSTIILYFYRSVLLEKLNTKIDSIVANIQFGHDRALITSKTEEWLDRFSILNTHTLVVLCLFAVSVLGLHLMSKQKFQVGLLCITLGIFGELTMFKAICVSYGDTVVFETSPEAVNQVRNLAKGGRVYQGSGVVLTREAFAPPNILSSQDVVTLDSYESIQYDSIYKATKVLAANERYNISNVKIALVPSNYRPYHGIELWDKGPSIANQQIYINPDVLPFITAIQNEVPDELESIHKILKEAKPVQLNAFTMSSLSFVAPESADFVRVAQNYHKGWKWRVAGNSDWVEVLRGVDQACYIPLSSIKGKEVEMKFFPRSSMSIWISLTVLCALLLGGIFMTLKK